MSNIWVSSDCHFCHDKEFIFKPRGFDNVYDMNETIIKNWNSLVNYDDTVYLLGDVMLNDNFEGINYLRRLNGNIKIILGNHDTDTRKDLYKELYNVEVLGYATLIKANGYIFYLSHYPTLTSNHDTDKPLKRQVINLCGHSHISDPFADFDKGLIYHCELDAHGNSPVSIEQIITDINKRV